MGEITRRRTEVICSHHYAVFVLDCENAGPRHDGLPTHRRDELEGEWGTDFDELCALDSLSKGVLNDAGPLVNRVGSITIKSIVPLRMDLSVSKYKNQEKRADGATPVGWEVIHDVGTGGERASVCR